MKTVIGLFWCDEDVTDFRERAPAPLAMAGESDDELAILGRRILCQSMSTIAANAT